MERISDLDILALIGSNREKGFRMLVAEYAEKIYWHIRRMVGSHQDAEDISQETFVRIFRSIDSLKTAVTMRGYIYRIATNETLRHMDRQKECHLPLDAVLTVQADPYVNYGDVEAVQLKKAIMSLPPRQQAVFNLRYYDELDYAEIASILDTTVGNVRANYHNAKDKIVRYMNSTD